MSISLAVTTSTPAGRAGAWSACAAYAKALGLPAVRALLARPHLAVWDDHDGRNDGGAEFEHKHEAKAAFLEAFQVPAQDPRRQREGLYTQAVFGPPGRRVQVLMLDTRWFRSPWRPSRERGAKGRERYEPNPDPDLTLLGADQWAWLAAQLAQPVEVRFLYSSIQVLAQGHGYERWGLFPHELQRLLRLLEAHPARATLMMSGDRHFGGLYRVEAATGAPHWELTSSGITHAWAGVQEDDPVRLGEPVRVNHYGVVDVDWEAAELRLRLHDTQGLPLLQHAVAFSNP
ncbi:MAG: alkaline phosphatase D family protein [Inhella sp.]